MLQLGADLDYSAKLCEEAPTQIQVGHLGAYVLDGWRLLLAIRRVRKSDLDTIEDDDLQLTELSLLPPDLVEADLLRNLARDHDLLLTHRSTATSRGIGIILQS